MGTQSSNSNNKKNKNLENESIQIDGLSSYKGLKSDLSSTQNENTIKSSSSNNISEKNTNDKETKKDERIPFKFEWKDGGNKVQITGSFLSNWTMFIEMVKNPETKNFEFNINLPKITHEFKFIVDGIWKCSKFYPTTKDKSGNENNVINLTNFISKEERNENNNKKNDNNKNEYNCHIPKKEEMNFDAPNVPYQYALPYNIDFYTKQNKIGKMNFINSYERNLLSENNSYKNIMVFPHVNLNHSCLCCEKIDNDCNFMKSAFSYRFKHKFLTIIYYTPVKKK